MTRRPISSTLSTALLVAVTVVIWAAVLYLAFLAV